MEIGMRAIVLTVLGFFVAGAATADELPPKVALVQKYLLEEDYPEVFGEQHYRIEVEDAVVADVDDDGSEEVILVVKPHYRQSPTVVLFTISKEGRVKRVIEGLAPGPLVPVSGDFLDSHAQGMGVDFMLQGVKEAPDKRDAFLPIALKNMGGVVEYANFLHSDGRKGRAPVYIDMRHVSAPEPTCEAFEFSPVDAIQVASRDDGSGNYLLALVGKELYVYKIKIRSDGLLEKKLEVKKAER